MQVDWVNHRMPSASPLPKPSGGGIDLDYLVGRAVPGAVLNNHGINASEDLLDQVNNELKSKEEPECQIY